MREFLIGFLCIIFFLNVSAQTPYQGGEGDGYAMISLTLETVSSVHENVQSLQIYPSIARPNQKISIESTQLFESIILVDVSGKRFILDGINEIILPNTLASGVYQLIALDKQQIYFSKIVVIDN
jgi:hypothetical protein